MTLKTLQEIDEEFFQKEGYHVFLPKAVKLLKQELIKYIKDLREHSTRTKDEIKQVMTDGELARLILFKTEVWIKHFFNIKEKDVK